MQAGRRHDRQPGGLQQCPNGEGERRWAGRLRPHSNVHLPIANIHQLPLSPDPPSLWHLTYK